MCQFSQHVLNARHVLGISNGNTMVNTTPCKNCRPVWEADSKSAQRIPELRVVRRARRKAEQGARAELGRGSQGGVVGEGGLRRLPLGSPQPSQGLPWLQSACRSHATAAAAALLSPATRHCYTHRREKNARIFNKETCSWRLW